MEKNCIVVTDTNSNTNILPTKIETERLYILPVNVIYSQILYTAIKESYKELQQWMAWAKTLPTLQQCHETCIQAYKKYQQKDDAMLLLFLKENSDLVGCSGLHNINWNLREFEIGYWGRTKYLGKGLISEGVLNITKYAINNLQANRVFLTNDEKNLKSSTLAERVGFKLEKLIKNERIDNNNLSRNTKIYFYPIKN